MSRIDAAISTQLADIARPQQVVNDLRLQTQQAQQTDLRAVENGPTTRPASPDEVKAAAASVKQVIEAASGHRLDFHVDEEAQELTVQIKDAKSGKVIRQIPAEDVLKMRTRIHEMVGMILDQEA